MRRLATALSTGLFLILLPTVALSQVPRLISYQGVLTDTLGTPKSDGLYSITFRFYKAQTGGSVIWSESKTLPVKHGLFSTMLGDQAAFPDSVNFTASYWLSVQVGPDELAPRIRLGSVGYAIRAINADTATFVLNAGSVARPISPGISNAELADNAVTSSKIQDSTITSGDVSPDFKAPRADTASVAMAALSSPPSGSAGGVLTGSYPNPGLANNAVTSSTIADSSILSVDVAPSFKAPKADTASVALVALTSAPSGSAGGDLTGAFPNPTIASDAVTSSKIADGTITTADVASTFKAPKADTATVALSALSATPGGSAGGDLTGSFPNPTIASDAITSSKIADGTITTADVASTFIAPKADTATIALAALASAPVGIAGGDLSGLYPAPSIADSAITSAKIRNGAVTDSKISDVSASKLTGALPAVDGSALTNLNAGNLGSGTVPDGRIGGTYANQVTLSNPNNNLTGKALSVGDTTLIADASSARVGVGTNLPVSTLDVQGSFGIKIVNVDAQTVDAGDAGLYLLNSSFGTATVNLPEASKSKGRVYYFKVVGRESPSQLQAYGEDLIESSSTFDFGTNEVNKLMIVCDGTRWQIIFSQY